MKNKVKQYLIILKCKDNRKENRIITKLGLGIFLYKNSQEYFFIQKENRNFELSNTVNKNIWQKKL